MGKGDNSSGRRIADLDTFGRRGAEKSMMMLRKERVRSAERKREKRMLFGMG